MYDNIIKILHLEKFSSIIEKIDTRFEDSKLIVELRLIKCDLKCPLCLSNTRYKCQVKNGQKCAVKIPHFDLIQVYL